MSKSDFKEQPLHIAQAERYAHFESFDFNLKQGQDEAARVTIFNAKRSEQYLEHEGINEETIIGIVLSGQGAINTRNGMRDLLPGMLYVSMPGDTYRIKSDQAYPLHTLSLHTTNWEWLTGRIEASFDVLPTVMYPRLFHEVEMLYWSIVRNASDESMFITKSLPHYVEIILKHMQEAALSTQKEQSIAWRTYERSIRYLREHYKSLHGVQDLADACELNPEYMSRLFKSYCSQSPLFLLQKYKIKHACQSLIFTNSSVKAIAFEVGYRDSATFSKVFKRKMGISPIAYRQRGGGV